MGTALNLSGNIFGKLTVISKVVGSTRPVRWACACQCGGESTPSTENLRSGNSTSCGCMKRTVLGVSTTKHALHGHPMYAGWKGMNNRCYNKNNASFKNYGGRGITVCDAWRNNFANYLNDMGERPAGMTLDRRDNALGYCKDNCRWATRSEQSRNTTANVNVTVNNLTLCVTDWITKIGVSRSAFHERAKRKGVDIAVRLYVAERPTLWALTSDMQAPYGTTIRLEV